MYVTKAERSNEYNRKRQFVRQFCLWFVVYVGTSGITYYDIGYCTYLSQSTFKWYYATALWGSWSKFQIIHVSKRPRIQRLVAKMSKCWNGRLPKISNCQKVQLNSTSVCQNIQLPNRTITTKCSKYHVLSKRLIAKTPRDLISMKRYRNITWLTFFIGLLASIDLVPK